MKPWEIVVLSVIAVGVLLVLAAEWLMVWGSSQW